MKLLLLFLPITLLASSAMSASYTKQDLVNALSLAGRSNWAQRVVIAHTNGPFYGYAGEQTVIGTGNPTNRYYSSDWGFLPQPHISWELEGTVGHPGVGYGYVQAYLATGDKFQLRAAKQLADAMLSAQADLDAGGWWYDMGTSAYDLDPESPTYRQTKDYGRWVNLFPYGNQGNYVDSVQNLASFDGVSPEGGMFLLSLYQAIPTNDASRAVYRTGLELFTDSVIGLSNVVDATNGLKPYGIGGVPQLYPYARVIVRTNLPSSAGYPVSIPYYAQVTLNDGALSDMLRLLIAMWQAAVTDPDLDEAKYLQAVRLQVDYLLTVRELNANPDGRGTWSAQYWLQDGSTNENRPAWARAMEPPSVSASTFNIIDLMILWHSLETDSTRKARIEAGLVNWCLYWKYNAPPVNSTAEWRALIASSPYYTSSMTNYSAGNPATWYWWIFYNHDTNLAPLNAFVSSNAKIMAQNPVLFVPYYGTNALVYGHYNQSGYPTFDVTPRQFLNILVEDPDPRVDLLHDPDDYHNTQLRTVFRLDADNHFFRLGRPSVTTAGYYLAQLNQTNGLFAPASKNIGGYTYLIANDLVFCTRMHMLSKAVAFTAGTLTDSDGDGLTDADETISGSDPFDSESVDPPDPEPPPPPPPLPPPAPINLRMICE